MARHQRIVLALSVIAAAGALAIAQPERAPTGAERRVQVQVDRMMQQDANGDGNLSADELPARLWERLSAADANGDGLLSREELTEHLSERAAPGGRNAPQRDDAGGASGGSAHELFEGAMKQAGGAMRELRRSPLDATTRDSDLAAVQSIQEAMVAAKGVAEQEKMAPQAVEKYGEDLDTYKRDLRMSFVVTLRSALNLEEAIVGGDAEAAKAALAALIEAQQTSHDMFQE